MLGVKTERSGLNMFRFFTPESVAGDELRKYSGITEGIDKCDIILSIVVGMLRTQIDR